MDFKDIVEKRYATKKFNKKKVPENLVKELLEMIRLSASSFNLQPWKIKVVTDQEVKKKLTPVSWNQPQIESCSHLLVLCADVEVKIDKLEQLMLNNGAKKEDIASYMKMIRDFVKRLNEKEKLEWAKRQVYIMLGNAINGAKSLGFDSCPMEGFDAVQYSKILGLPKNIVPTALCAIGYADDTPKPKLRFPKEEVFF